MRSERLWQGGRFESAIRVGVPVGALYGLMQFGFGRPPSRAISAGIFFGVVFGIAMALSCWRKWPGASALSAADRMKVVRIVRFGLSVEDPRLAPAVIEYAGVVRRAQERDRRFGWVLWVFAAGTVFFAFGSTVGGHLRAAIVWWVLVAFWAFMLMSMPRRTTNALERAAQAEASAKQI